MTRFVYRSLSVCYYNAYCKRLASIHIARLAVDSKPNQMLSCTWFEFPAYAICPENHSVVLSVSIQVARCYNSVDGYVVRMARYRYYRDKTVG